MTDDRLEEIRKRCDAMLRTRKNFMDGKGSQNEAIKSANFVKGHAPSDIPYLLSELEKAKAKTDACSWEADNAKLQLEGTGISPDEFPFGCDTLQHVATALLGQRNHSKQLEQELEMGKAESAVNLLALRWCAQEFRGYHRKGLERMRAIDPHMIPFDEGEPQYWIDKAKEVKA